MAISLQDFLSEREAQAQRARACHLAPVANQESMLFWIALACKRARESAGRIQSQVAASAIVDQSTINRFENHISWPRSGADHIVTAYAHDLDIDAFQLWQEAVRLWESYRAGDKPAA